MAMGRPAEILLVHGDLVLLDVSTNDTCTSFVECQ